MMEQPQALSPGKVALTTWFLEMFAPPVRAQRRVKPAGLEIPRLSRPPIHFYRYIYTMVGSPWVWWERRIQSDETIMQEIHDPKFEFFVPYLNHIPIGMVELNKRGFPEVQLNYFGLIPEYCGQGIGGFLLEWMTDRVFESGAKRFWVHTCSLDSPNALPAYQNAGFSLYGTQTEMIDDPRLLPNPPA